MERSGFVSLNGRSQYSAAAFDEQDARPPTPTPNLTEESINALHELTRGTVDEEFDLKQRLYETKDAFHEIELYERITTGEEIDALKKHVKQGQQMLKSEIIRYSSLKDRLEQSKEVEEAFHSQVTQMKRSVLVLGELNVQSEDYATDLREIHEKLEAFEGKIKEDFEMRTADVKTEYGKSLRLLVQLKDVYQVCRDSDVSYACPVCLQCRVECFMVPCGHTFCSECVKPSNSIRKICHMCRNPYTRICTLYYA